MFRHVRSVQPGSGRPKSVQSGSSRWLAGVLLVVTCAVVSCGGSGGGSGGGQSGVDDAGTGASTTAPVTFTECTVQASSVGLGEGFVCADSGFRPGSDDFSFPNWAGVTDDDGGDRFTVDNLVALFGADAVCVDATATPCEPTPVAARTIEDWNSALNGGRCEGMATLSVRYFLGLSQSGVDSASQLVRPNPSLEQDINYWWATQFVDEVKAAAAESRTLDPVVLTQRLIDGLAAGDGYTIGLYADGFGHAVTPTAVTKVGDDYVVHIYDNNAPGEARTISIDTATATWSYAGAAQNPDGTPKTWSGSTGTFELTPMKVRSGPFTCAFCDQDGATDAAKGHVTVNLVAAGSASTPAAGLLITTGDGRKVGIEAGLFVNEVDGADYSVGKGGIGTSLIAVRLPESSTDYSVQVVSATGVESDEQVDTSVSIAVPNGSITAIRARRPIRAQASAVPSRGEGIVIGSDTGVDVGNDLDADMQVSVATRRDRVDVALPPRAKLANRDNEGSATISAVDETGSSIVDRSIPVRVVARANASGTSVPRTSTSVPRTTTTVARTSTSVARTSTSVPRTTTTVARTSTSVVRTSTTIARTSTTVARSSSSSSSSSPTSTASSVPRTSTTVARSSSTSTSTSSSTSTTGP